MSRILENVRNSVQDLYDAGTVDKVTLRKVEELCLSEISPMTPEEIKSLRLQESVSQAIFAKYLNVQTVTIQKWESGQNKPNATASKLLHLIKRSGLKVLAF